MVTPAVRVRPEQGFLRSAVAQILIALLVLPPQLFAARGSVVSEPDAGRPERTLSDPRWALPTSPVLPATDPDLPDPAVINSPATVAVATAARPAVLAGRESAPPSTAGLTVASLLPVSLDLGAARRFNGFFFESFTASSSDIEGRLAAGGSVSINHYSIASKLSASASGASLVVGGDLTFPDGRVHGGDIVVGGSAAGLGPAVRNGLGPNQHVYEHAPLPFDFEQERERIERTSQALATLTPNGTVEWKWGGLYLHGDCESPSQVFALSGPQVLDAHTFQVDCVPDGATVVFNINGASAGLTNMSLESLASHQSTTLFHFPEATTLTLRGVGVRGSILAPHAHVDQPQGQVDGSVIARSWNGPMELHNVPFRGVGSGDFCPLYPIVLPYELLSDAEPGQQFLQVPRGHSLGQFSWLSWAGHPNAVTLAQSLLPPGDSYTYVNPDDDTDWLLNVGEWVQGAPGSMNAAAVRRNLDALIGEEIFVPAWSATRGQGSQFDYQTAAFVAVKLLDYRLTGNGWLSFEYLGPAYCYNAPPTVDAGPDRTIELPPGTTTLQGSAEDDGLPNGSLTTSWERLSGPGSVSFVDAQALTTMATFSAVGEYVLRLTADDGELQASDEVWITVEAAQVNEPPLVDAGADQEIVLPIDTVTLEGTVTDDGLPAGGSTTVSWSMTSGPAAVEFATPDSVVTAARFVATGTYVLHLAASDGELTGEDSVTVTVRPPPVPVLVVGDATVTEGHSGTIPAQIALTLSFAPDSEVRVDFQAQDETALSGSDYRPAFGSVVFPAGATSQTITVDVVGDLAIEADETFSVRLGNVVGATLARERAIVTIVNDDSQNLPPLPIEPRAPADGARGVSSDALLTWQSSDPEGMPLAYDVFFGKTFGVTGQSWAAHDVASSNPGARWGAVTAYDERNDRMMVYGGETSAGFADTDLHILVNASGSGGAPAWTRIPLEGGPGPLAFAVGAFDPSSNRLIVFGGCVSACTTPGGETWALEGANGLGSQPSWTRLDISGPGARFGQASAFDASGGRFFVYGGASSEGGPALGDLWVLEGLGVGTPRWQAVTAADSPSARRDAALAFDARSNRLLLFGGRTGANEPQGDLHALALDAAAPAWVSLSAGGAGPAARFGAAVAFDAASQRLLLYGGTNGSPAEGLNYVFADAWLLTEAGEGGQPSWHRIDVASSTPPGRFLPSAIYSASANRLVVALGANNKLEQPPADVSVLAEAFGQLPLVSAGQSAAAFPAEQAATGEYYFWRIVARDPAGAWRGAPAWRFTMNQPPTVDAGPDLSLEGTPATVALTGSVEDDGRPVGAAVVTRWTQMSGPAPVAFADPSAASTSATFEVAGTYVLAFEANDSQATAVDELVVEVRVANLPPVVDAGSDVHGVAPGATISLVGSASDDGLPQNVLTVQWRQLGGPTPVAIADPGSLSTTVQLPMAGTYALELLASDGALSATDDLAIEVVPDNLAPQVSAGPDLVIGDPQTAATLAGEASDDGLPAGALTTVWTAASGPGTVAFGDATALDTTALFSAPGRYELRLTASDGVLSGTDQTVVIVGSPGQLPDLTVRTVDVGSLVVDPQTLVVSGAVVVDVGNLGPGTVASAFSVTTFEDLDADGAFTLGVDAVLGEQSVAALEAGGNAVIEIPVSGHVTFAGNLVYALVDSGYLVEESSEGNNYGSSSPGCRAPEASGGWSVGVEWAWTKTDVDPESTFVVNAPIVVDVNGDQVPDVLFVSTSPSSYLTYASKGRLRALDGRDGHELWSIIDPNLALTGSTRLAAGDIDADGRVEILAIAEGGGELYAFEHDGTHKWTSDTLLHMAWGGAFIADLDADGSPEIVVGRQALTNEGHLLWTGSVYGQGGAFGPNSVVVDLDLDGAPEVLVGNTAYRAQGPNAGGVLWSNTSTVGGQLVSDGYTAVGNFDEDPFPEIVLAGVSAIFLLEHDGTVKWGPVIPDGGRGGAPPTVADLDGDGELEIAIARAQYLHAFDTDGSEMWRVGNQDSTPNVGIVAFDFDGDGAAELVHAAEADLRILDGRNGFVLYRDVNGSNTVSDSVVVADVDADGEAEIVSVTDGKQPLGPDPGVRVYGEGQGLWPDARRIWNQYQYSVTNVNDDGTIPRREHRDLALGHRWAVAGSVADDGVFTPSCAFPQPDLTASAFNMTDDGVQRRLTVRIGNGGARVVGPGVPVSFYDDDPRIDPVRLSTVETTTHLRPGQYEIVEIALPVSLRTRGPVFVSADDFGHLRGRILESDEDNNIYDTGMALLATAALPDLSVADVDISGLAGDWQTLAVSGRGAAVVQNLSPTPVQGPFEVSFFEDRDGDGAFGEADTLLGRAVVDGLGAHTTTVVEAPLSGSLLFRGSIIRTHADSGGVVPEVDEANNVGRAGESCRVQPPGPPWSLREEWVWANAGVVSSPAVGDLDGDGVSDAVFVAMRGGETVDGQLSAVTGRNGTVLFSVSDRTLDLNPAGSVALGDIDGDGHTEIVAIGEAGNVLLAFEADGTFKWRSAALAQSVGAGAPFLADLDGDGQSEIVIGKQVLRGSDGSILWTGGGAKSGRSSVSGAHSIAADLDLDGRPEVVVGSSAYRADGTLLWDAPTVPDGMAVVANLDDDPYPEVVVVANELWLLEHDGTATWSGRSLGWGGPATIADFDGDGQPEIGVGSRLAYAVYESYGHVKWSVATDQSDTHWNTGGGASAFDFDGDGAFEIVYASPSGLHILSGRDGSVVSEIATGSCSYGHPVPVMADVDGDGKVEILLGSNPCASSTVRGLRAFGEAGDGWVRSRAVWNQYEYSVSGIRDDLTSPWPSVPANLRENSWRANRATSGSAFASADLTASYVRRTEAGTDLRFVVRVGNAGMGPVAAGVPVSLYHGDPRRGYPFIASTTTSHALAPGEYEDVSFVVESRTEGQDALVFVVDDPGTQTSTVSECDEENNFQASGFWLNRRPQVDIGPSPEVSMPDATAVLAATATDDGLPLGADLSIAWYWLTDSGDFIQTIFSDPHSLRPTVTFPRAGQYRLMLQVSDSRLAAQRSLTVVVHPANEAPVVSAGADQVLALPADTLTLAGSASDDGRPAGSSLEVVWTAVSGPGPVTFANPASPATTATLTTVGTYVLRLTASDGALTTSDDVEVELEPANQAPVVDAGRDARVLALVVPLTGSVTDDGKPRGGTLVSNWTAVSGPGPVAFADASAPTTVATCSAPGTYVLRLSASDGELTATDEVTIVANPGNEPPFVEAGPSQAVTSRRTVLEGTVRDDGLPADSTVAILWSQVSGPAPAALATPAASESAVLFDAEGAYVFRLQASDGDLASEDLVAVEVRFVNLAPTVEAGADAEITLPASSLLLQGSVSDDGLPLGGMLTQSWALVSGPAGVVIDQPQATETLVHFVEPGIYVLRLRGSDGTLRCDDTVTIVVRGTPPSGAAPVASLSVPSSGARLTIPTEVVGTATSDTLAGWQLQRRLRGDSEWVRFASGTEAVSDGPLGILDPTQLLNGIHEVRLQVTDSSGRIARATVVVVVRDQVKVGHFTVSFVDLEVPVAGVPLRVTRTYDSRDKTRGDFGVGWRLDVSNVRVQPAATLGLAWYGTASAGAFPTYCIQPTAPPIVTLTFPDGRVEEFEMRLSKECQPMAPIPATQVSFVRAGATLGRLELIGSADVEIVGSWPGPMQLFGSEYSLLDPAAYRYTAPDGRIFVVDRATGLRSLTDTAGNVLTVTFAGITASHPSVPGSSLGISFTRDTEGRITRVTDPSNHVLEYEYDAAGDLVSVTDREENETTFTYLEDPAHHLLEIHDPLGRRAIRNEYYDDGRIKSHTDAFGNTITYTHSLEARQEIVQDRSGGLRVLEYDERGNVLREVQPDGKVIVREFTAFNHRTSETLPFDPSTTTPEEAPKTVYTYENQGTASETENVVAVLDPENNLTEYRYDTRNQVTHTKDPRGNWTVNDYDPAKGWLLRTEVRKGAENGQVLSRTEYEYWPNGQAKKQRVFSDLGAGTVIETSYLTDPRGNVTEETDALGQKTSYTYDGNGNRRTQTTTRTRYTCDGTTCTASGTEALVTQYEYDLEGRITRTIDPDGTFTETVYDAAGRQLETYDKLRRKTSYDYDRWDAAEGIRWDKTTYADLTYDETGYDAEGRRVRHRDRAGRVTRYEYDPMGRLSKTTYPPAKEGEAPAVTESRYDDAGRLVESIDARLHSTFYGYDAAGRRTSVRQVVDGETIETTFHYDANGNQDWVKDPQQQTTGFVYDEQNRRVRTDYPAAREGEAPTSSETEYDALGRRTAEVDQAGKRTEFGYDDLGRLTSVTQYLEGRAIVTEYGYDDIGNRIWQKDANQHVTGFEYDSLGREVARILPGGARETKEYWPDGQLKARTDFMGRRTTYDYDPDTARLASRRSYDASGTEILSAAVSYEYTATGRRDTVTDSRGATVYAYDGRDRLVSLTQPSPAGADPRLRRLEYGHDPNGNRTALTTTIGGQVFTISSSYDEASRLDLVTDPLDRVYDHGYDLNGNRASLAYPNGVATAYGYDNLNRLRSLVTTMGTGPDAGRVQSYDLTLGPSGNRTQIIESQGLPQQRTLDFGYDDLYRLTSETVTELMGSTPTLSYQKSFVYDDVGNRESQATTLGPLGPPTMAAGTIDYGYDDRDRLETEALAPNPATAYAWDLNGNLTTKDGEATYTWDVNDRLLKVEKTDGTLLEHVYDADGNRVRTTTTKPGQAAAAVDFLVDTSGGLSHVVAEIDATGTTDKLKTLYVRSNDELLALMRPLVDQPASATDWQTRFYHADYIGSVRRLTDKDGYLTDDGYTYSAFGELLAHTGSDPQPYAFTGEPLDPNVGWQYHRARWMDPRVGRFTSLDPWPGRTAQPLTLQKYVYAHDQPIRYGDPSGKFLSTAIGLTVLGAILVLAAVHGVPGFNVTPANSMITVRTQPVTDGGWSDGEILNTIREASSFWTVAAGIRIEPILPIQHEDGGLYGTYSAVATAWGKEGATSTDWAEADRLMDFLPKGKHLTLFTPFLAQGVDGWGPVITAPSRHFGRGLVFLGGNASGTAACHEYGHTFGLRHTFLDVPLIGTLFAAPMPNIMGGIWSMAKYLTPEQAAVAREVASDY